ncbi:MAG: glutamate--tRNA ligase [Candidatus Pacearchaeota archaeon]
MAKDFNDEIHAYALENAIVYGKAIESVVLTKLFQHGLKKEGIKDVMVKIKEIVSFVNSLKNDEKISEFKKYKSFLKEKPAEEKGLKELPKSGKHMVFRMAPFPSGGLHIGNTKTYLLNALYSEKYKGKTFLVIDDTIGSEEKRIIDEAYNLIPQAFNYLKVKYNKPIIYKSDRLKIYYKYAEQLIKKGKAYVCSCSHEQLRENRANQRECACRHMPIEEQIKRWRKMFKAKEGEYTLRIKTSMQNPNPAFRDRVLCRISEREHPRVGKKYRIWPMLEFSWAIDDHLLKVTHIIRGKELMIEGEMQKYIWDIFKWKHPELIYVGLVKLEGIGGKLSKSKAQKEVLSGEYSGWDDPRTWSVQSLERRGILANSIREFIEKIGLNQNEITVPIEELYAINRKKIDSTSGRYFFVENPVEIKIPEEIKKKSLKVKLYPEKNEYKVIIIDKNIFIALKDFNDFKDKDVRLMHFCNINLKKIPQFISEENNLKIQKIHWVSKSVKARIMMPNGIYTKGIAESSVSKLKPGEMIQFERFGFARFDHFDKKLDEYEFWFSHD